MTELDIEANNKREANDKLEANDKREANNRLAENEQPRAKNLLNRAAPWLEFAAVCGLSLLASAGYIYWLNGANLTLLFDGFGYLLTTQGCITVFDASLFNQIFTYCTSGFDDHLRLALSEKMSAASGLFRSGPLLPTWLAGAYLLSGKPPTPQYWAVGTWAMWAVQALTIGLIWLAARTSFGSKVARIAAFFAIAYAPFIVNGNRISTETQACLGVIAASYLFLYLGKKDFAPAKSLNNGFLSGLVLGFLALARPPFLLLPVLQVVTLSIAGRLSNLRFPFGWRWFLGVVCGAAMLLAPWAVCNKILTNKFSIAIDRYAIYNLYTGLSTRSRGFDVIPGEFVEHPERFNMTLHEALNRISAEASAEPVAFAQMMALKPARLLDSPWNDCQTSCYGVPWLVQRYWHQMLLLLSFFGISVLWQRALKERSWSALTPAITFSLVILYNLIHVLFITMNRYTYPIMPVFIVAAAYGLFAIWRQCKHKFLVLGALAAAPLPSFLFESFNTPFVPLVSQLASSAGVSIMAAALAFLIFLGMPAFVSLAQRQMNFEPRTVLNTTFATIACSLFCMIAAYCGVRQTLVALPCDAKEDNLSVSVAVPGGNWLEGREARGWFVVVDPAFEGFSLEALQSCRFAVNGTELNTDLLPLLMTDHEERSYAVYEKAFSHSGKRDTTTVRQWYCIAVPPHLVRAGKVNNVAISQKAPVDKSSSTIGVRLMCDVLEDGKDVAPAALRQFSWSKGFTVNPPLDMRMPATSKVVERSTDDPMLTETEKPGRLRPRLYLLAVGGTPGGGADYPALTAPIGEADVITFPEVSIGPGKQDKVVTLNIAPDKLQRTISGIKNGTGNSIRLKVSGEIVAEAGSGEASIAAITNMTATVGSEVSSSETMAPLAPEIIAVSPQTTDVAPPRSFSFIDIIPAFTDADGKDIPLDGTSRRDFEARVRLLIAGKPWWDVLQYASYKIERSVRVRNLRVEAAPTNLPSLGRQKTLLFRALPLKETPAL